MPSVNLLKTNFTAGEFSPNLYGRTDIDRYNNAAKEILNAYPLNYGGVVNRNGSLYVAPAKYADRDTVLIAFAYNTEQTYILEFGDFYMRVYKNRVQVEISPGVPYEIVTPFSQAVLRKIDFQQSADTMFIECETVYPQRLQRFADADWFMGNAPIKVEPFDELGLVPAQVLTLSSAAIGARTATVPVATFLASDVGRFLLSGRGTSVITAVNTSLSVNVNVTAAFSGVSLASGTWKLDLSPQTTCTPSSAAVIGTQINLTLALAGWRSSDIGKYVKINNGLCLINGITSDLIATAIVKESLTSAAGAPALAWSLNSSIWSVALGYPRTGLLHQQRLFLGGSTRYPQSFAASQIGSLVNFQEGINDDDGFLFNIAASQDQIVHMIDNRQMLTIGSGGIFSITGGVEKPLTPTNVQIRSQADDGGCDVRPIKIENEIYYVSRSKKRLLTAAYKIDIDGFDVIDISKIADHIAALGIKEVSYQKDPNRLLYAVLNNGAMATVTIDRAENVTGWAKQTTQGSYDSVATIPVEGTQESWVIVNRNIAGVAKKYIEVFTPDLYMDAAIMGINATATRFWAGLAHLENATVIVVGDDYVLGTFVVNAGQIELPIAVKAVSIGLSYTSRLVSLPVEINLQEGSSQGKNVHLSEVVIKLRNTLGAMVNGVAIPYRKLGDPTDQPIPPYTGSKKIKLSGWAEDDPGIITIVQDQPLPLHVQSIMRKVTVNG